MTKTVPDNKKLLNGTVPIKKKLLNRTVPVIYKLLTGTVPVNNFYQHIYVFLSSSQLQHKNGINTLIVKTYYWILYHILKGDKVVIYIDMSVWF